MSFSRFLWRTLCVFFVMASVTALAESYPVTCPANIQATVDLIAATLPNGPNEITVEGTCVGRVVIKSLKNLTIRAGESGGGISTTDINSAVIVNISDSFNIKIWDLVLDGNGYAGGIGVNSSQQVEAQKVPRGSLKVSSGGRCHLTMPLPPVGQQTSIH